MTTLDPTPIEAPAAQPWHDTTLPVAERVERLLAAMTLEEKVAQLGSRWDGNDMQESDAGHAVGAVMRAHAQRRDVGDGAAE